LLAFKDGREKKKAIYKRGGRIERRGKTGKQNGQKTWRKGILKRANTLASKRQRGRMFERATTLQKE